MRNKSIQCNITEINTGDILLVSGRKWLARAIQFFEKNKWNHAAVFIWLYDELFVCESDKRGISLTKFSDYISGKAGLMYCSPKIKDDKLHPVRLASVMLPKCGHVPYDFVNLLFYQPIRFMFGKWIGRKQSKSDKRFICGEWCAYVYNKLDYKYFPNWNKIAPVDIFNDDKFDRFLIRE